MGFFTCFLSLGAAGVTEELRLLQTRLKGRYISDFTENQAFTDHLPKPSLKGFPQLRSTRPARPTGLSEPQIFGAYSFARHMHRSALHWHHTYTVATLQQA